MIIFLILIILLCIVLKLKLITAAYFNTVNIGILFLGYFIVSLQLISFCIMNAQIFDSSIRAIVVTLIIAVISIKIHSWTILCPSSVQYVLIFFSPIIAHRSLFQVRKIYYI